MTGLASSVSIIIDRQHNQTHVHTYLYDMLNRRHNQTHQSQLTMFVHICMICWRHKLSRKAKVAVTVIHLIPTLVVQMVQFTIVAQIHVDIVIWLHYRSDITVSRLQIMFQFA